MLCAIVILQGCVNSSPSRVHVLAYSWYWIGWHRDVVRF